MTRSDFLKWCKDRALAYVDRGDKAGAIGSMMSDLNKWEGDQPFYDPEMLKLLYTDAVMFRHSPADIRNWIEGFG